MLRPSYLLSEIFYTGNRDQVIVFPDLGFQLLASSQCQDVTENANMFNIFLTIQHDEGLCVVIPMSHTILKHIQQKMCLYFDL